MYDFVVIGGGISGLYFTNKISEINPDLKICIFEKTNRVGGRIDSLNIKNDIIETGALRFNKNHVHIIDLIKKFGLQNNEIKMEKKLILNINGKNKNQNKNLLRNIGKKILKDKKNNNKTFQEYVEDNYYGNDVEFIKTQYSFLNEYFDMNAYALAYRLNNEDGDYSYLKNPINSFF